MKVIEEVPRVRVMEGSWSPLSVIREVVGEGGEGQEDPFYVMDLGEVVTRYQHWKELMPRVEPFYAVKCNDDPVLVRTLAALGAGFDCASKNEIKLVTDMGVRPERIIFANPAKMASHIRYAKSVGVDAMTFDSETELMKVKQHMPQAQLVIRIRCDAAGAQCPLGIKFGCDPVLEAPRLLKLAAVLGLDVIGVSFHVGSNAGETAVYARAIQYCKALFTLGADLGLGRMRLVDIGGGFPGGTDTDIKEVSAVINSALELHFPEKSVRVIAEPGRYFAAAAYTLAAVVHAKRELPVKDGDEASNGTSDTHTMYFINDGVYGSFNCILYDHQHVVAQPLNPSSEKLLPCSVWGPTCDGLDCVLPSTRLPPLKVGDWLVFKDMGAYTIPVASAFNGFPVPTVKHVVSEKLWAMLKDLWPLSEDNFTVGMPHAPSSPPPASPPASPSPPHNNNHHHLHAIFVECALK
ncbi:pyridoxal-dependent decarboxylase, pyridoxal binding domain-containing protein [Phthorimaea operculella]|nr:pyridoxal-dependent decarboxylase, pyridoxal binding domain-containing protein [Phthorimaea operculella]